MRVKASYYRKQAQRSRDLAKRVLAVDVKRHLLNVAEEYDKLAADSESKE